MIINIDEKIEQLVAESLKPLYNKIYIFKSYVIFKYHYKCYLFFYYNFTMIT